MLSDWLRVKCNIGWWSDAGTDGGPQVVASRSGPPCESERRCCAPLRCVRPTSLSPTSFNQPESFPATSVFAGDLGFCLSMQHRLPLTGISVQNLSLGVGDGRWLPPAPLAGRVELCVCGIGCVCGEAIDAARCSTSAECTLHHPRWSTAPTHPKTAHSPQNLKDLYKQRSLSTPPTPP